VWYYAAARKWARKGIDAGFAERRGNLRNTIVAFELTYERECHVATPAMLDFDAAQRRDKREQKIDPSMMSNSSRRKLPAVSHPIRWFTDFLSLCRRRSAIVGAYVQNAQEVFDDGTVAENAIS